MTNDRFEELLNAEIDGLITPAETAELEALVAANPGARQTRSQLLEIGEVLRQVEAVDPPAGMTSDLMAALPDKSPQPGMFRFVAQALAGRRMLVYGYGMAAILLLAFVTREFISPVTTVSEKDGVAGTMAPSETRHRALDSSETAFDAPGIAGSIRLVRHPSEIVVEVDATSDAPLVLALGYDATRLTLNQVVRNGGLVASAESQPGRVLLGGGQAPGELRHQYRVALSEADQNNETTVFFTFLESGEPIHAGSLAVPARGGQANTE